MVAGKFEGHARLKFAKYVFFPVLFPGSRLESENWKVEVVISALQPVKLHELKCVFLYFLLKCII